MILTVKVLIAAWVFLAPALIMGETGWMAGTFLHLGCLGTAASLGLWGLVLATKDLLGREDR